MKSWDQLAESTADACACSFKAIYSKQDVSVFEERCLANQRGVSLSVFNLNDNMKKSKKKILSEIDHFSVKNSNSQWVTNEFNNKSNDFCSIFTVSFYLMITWIVFKLIKKL